MRRRINNHFLVRVLGMADVQKIECAIIYIILIMGIYIGVLFFTDVSTINGYESIENNIFTTEINKQITSCEDRGMLGFWRLANDVEVICTPIREQDRPDIKVCVDKGMRAQFYGEIHCRPRKELFHPMFSKWWVTTNKEVIKKVQDCQDHEMYTVWSTVNKEVTCTPIKEEDKIKIRTDVYKRMRALKVSLKHP